MHQEIPQQIKNLLVDLSNTPDQNYTDWLKKIKLMQSNLREEVALLDNIRYDYIDLTDQTMPANSQKLFLYFAACARLLEAFTTREFNDRETARNSLEELQNQLFLQNLFCSGPGDTATIQ